MSKYKFQVGGESTGFFQSIVNAYQSQQEPEYEPSYEPEVEASFQEDDTSDYDQLLENYNSLQADYEELMQKQADVASLGMQDTGDDFMDFLFSNSSKGPINFDDFDFSAPSTPNQPVGNKEQAAFQFFTQKGYPAHVAAGIVANIKHESNFNPAAVGDGGKARSLAQWHPDRYKRLTQAGFNLNDFNESLAAIDHELKTSEQGAYNSLLKAQSAEEAAAIFDKKYERSAGLSTRQRMQSASNLLRNSKYQVGGQVYRTQEEVDAANMQAKQFAKRKSINRNSIVNPEDTIVARKIGDPIVQYYDESGTNITGMPSSNTPKLSYTLPWYVEEGDIQSNGSGYFYEDKMDGRTVYVDSSVVSKKGWAKRPEEVEKDLIARTAAQQRIGLNDPKKSEMFFPNSGINTFRGLDSGHPVMLVDEVGTQAILNNKYQTVQLQGNVYEKKLK